MVKGHPWYWCFERNATSANSASTKSERSSTWSLNPNVFPWALDSIPYLQTHLSWSRSRIQIVHRLLLSNNQLPSVPVNDNFSVTHMTSVRPCLRHSSFMIIVDSQSSIRFLGCPKSGVCWRRWRLDFFFVLTSWRPPFAFGYVGASTADMSTSRLKSRTRKIEEGGRAERIEDMRLLKTFGMFITWDMSSKWRPIEWDGYMTIASLGMSLVDMKKVQVLALNVRNFDFGLV